MKTKTITFLFLAALFGVSALFGDQNEMQGCPMQGCNAKRCAMKEGSSDSKMMEQKSDQMAAPNQVSAGTNVNKGMTKEMSMKKDMTKETTDMDMEDEDEDDTEDKNEDKNKDKNT